MISRKLPETEWQLEKIMAELGEELGARVLLRKNHKGGGDRAVGREQLLHCLVRVSSEISFIIYRHVIRLFE